MEAIISAIEQSHLNRGLTGHAWLSDPDNVPFVKGDDIILFDGNGNGDFEIHLLMKSRGQAAMHVIKEAFAYLFQRHSAEMIFAMVPDFRRDINLLARRMRMRFVGMRNTSYGPCALFILSKDRWIHWVS